MTKNVRKLKNIFCTLLYSLVLFNLMMTIFLGKAVLQSWVVSILSDYDIRTDLIYINILFITSS